MPARSTSRALPLVSTDLALRGKSMEPSLMPAASCRVLVLVHGVHFETDLLEAGELLLRLRAVLAAALLMENL